MGFEQKFRETEIEKIPKEWEVNLLGEVLELSYGKGLAKNKRTKGQFPVFGSNGIIDFHNKFLVEGPGIIVGRKGSVGEITFCKTNFWPIDTTYFVKLKEEGAIRFWYYFLKTLNLNKMNAHSAVPGLNRDQVYELKQAIPNLKEQHRIASVLSSLDDKIELNRRMNKTLKMIGQAIFKHWFVDFVFPNEEGKPHKSSGGEMVFNEELEKEIPKGWHIGRLGEIIQNFDSKRVPLSSREREKRRGIYPYYGATKIMDYVDDYLFDGTYLLMAEDGSVIDDEGYPVLQYVWGKFWANNHTHIIKGEGVSTEFVYLLLSKTNIARYVTGAVQPKLNQANMNSMNILIPDNAIIKNFDSTIQIIFTKKKLIFEQIQSLQKTRDLLLPKLMSGKIRVPVEVE
jgi:type I restriction enzyme S subunit